MPALGLLDPADGRNERGAAECQMQTSLVSVLHVEQLPGSVATLHLPVLDEPEIRLIKPKAGCGHGSEAPPTIHFTSPAPRKDSGALVWMT
ncbi:hypothetical protein TgHK011_006544 [Trichoderma gracile]|nr:hypothetical protein TgHK011_006544 [Trichoderma gracile]